METGNNFGFAFGDIELDRDRRRVARSGRPIDLGPTEYRLLEFFLEHPGRVFSREELDVLARVVTGTNIVLVDYIPSGLTLADSNWTAAGGVATKNTARPPKNGTSSAAMTALAMANLFVHMHRGLLISPAASTTMRGIFRAGGAWLSTLPNKDSFSFTDDGAKVGHSGSNSAFVGSVMSEAAFLNRKNDGTPFLAIWQNVPDELDSEPIYRVLDEMIAAGMAVGRDVTGLPYPTGMPPTEGDGQ